MVLSAVEVVRLKTSDQSTFVREDQWSGNGVDNYFKMNNSDLVSATPMVVYKNGVVVAGANYTVNYTVGSVTFTVAPANDDALIFEYWTIVFTDEEITQFLTEAGNNTDYAAAKNLFAWAANAAKLAKKETLMGGGGRGEVIVDLAVRAEQLRKSAQSYLDNYVATAVDDQFGPADGITEVAWTEQMYDRILEQEIIRNS
jgi:hypothetical protein